MNSNVPELKCVCGHLYWEHDNVYIKKCTGHKNPHATDCSFYNHGCCECKTFHQGKKTILEVITELTGQSPVQYSNELKAICCPWHEDKKPSLVIYEKTSSYFCYPCVLGTSWAVTPVGIKQIKDLVIGEKILGRDGEFVTIQKIMVKQADSLVKFTLAKRHFPLIVTPEHRMFKISQRKRITEPAKNDWYNLRKASFEECLAKDVEVGDLMGLPKIKLQEVKEWDISKYLTVHGGPNHNKGPVSKVIPTKLKVDSDLLWLFGIYAAEGHVGSKGRTIIFTLHRDEVPYANRILQTIDRVFGIKGKIHPDKDTKAIDIIICNVYLGDLFEAVCGKYAKNKKLPYDLWLANDFSLLRGLFDGDAHDAPLKKGQTKGYITLTTISEHMAWQVYLLLIGFGHTPNFRKVLAHVDKNGKNKQDAYHVNYSLSKTSAKSGFIKDHYVLEVTNKESLEEKAEVYDLTVDGEQFVVDGILTHNCSVGGDAYNFYSRFKGCSYKAAKEALDGNVDTLVEIGEYLDGLNVKDEIDYRDQLNFSISKWARDLMYVHPDQVDNILRFLEKLDKEVLTKPVTSDILKQVIEESRRICS